ncbi:MAG: amino acid permease [Candidatus Omnitrophica bacterium]|nr:amino acid permease [Candidatus Omnitrophota bacterium]
MVKVLRKELGFWDVFCIASGAMISSGLFILPAIAAGQVGPSLFLAYMIASFIALPTVLSKAELVTAMPRAGGDYFYISRSMGFVTGGIGGFGTWFSLSLKAAFALIGMAAYVSLFTSMSIQYIALILCVAFGVLNIFGIKLAARMQIVLVLGLFSALIFYIVRGFPAIDINNFKPFAPYGVRAIFATAGFVFISYGGLTKIASIAEEVRQPTRNIPLGMLASLVIVGIIYTLVAFVTTGLLNLSDLSSSLTPISDAAYQFGSSPARIIMAIAAFLAFISTANAGIISASRYPMAMSRDKLLPKFFNRVNSRYQTPHYSIIFTVIFMLLAISVLDLKSLVKIASELLIIIFMFTNLAVIIMRESKMPNYKPTFRSPLYPVVQIAGILGCLFLLAEMGKILLLFSIMSISVGILGYFVLSYKKKIREFAIIHVIERIVNKEFTSGTLSQELKNVIRQRDDIVEDRFDKLIEEAVVLDIRGRLPSSLFFQKVADALTSQLSLKPQYLRDLLNEREKESSTVIHPGLAIPHIVIEGENKFNILLARANEGIIFPELEDQPVHTVFVLVGTKDERNFHLQALAAIAQICQEKNFEKKWLDARNVMELKDVLLLTERKRFGKPAD